MHHYVSLRLGRSASPSPLAFLRLLCVGLVLFWAGAAGAQSAAVAEALFEDGRRLYDEGKFDAACAKFAESQKLDPGTGTLLNLANCYEKAGRLATAWATWKEAAASARTADQSDREAHARQRADHLGSRVARLTIRVAPAARVEGLVVRQNGQPQSAAIWGTALPVDAGTYEIEASAPGYEPWQREVVVQDGDERVVEVNSLEPSQAGAVAAPPAGEPEPTEEKPDEPAPSEEKQGSVRLASDDDDSVQDGVPGRGRRVAGLITGGVGLVLTGVGAALGVDALAKNEESKDYCDPEQPNRCSSEGVQLRDDALTSGMASTILIGAGAAALTTGVVLFLTAPRAKTTVAAAPTWGGASLLITGRF